MKSISQFVADVHRLQADNALTNAEAATAMAAILVTTSRLAGIDALDLVRQAQAELTKQLPVGMT